MTQDAIMHEDSYYLCNPSMGYRLNLISQLTAALLIALIVAVIVNDNDPLSQKSYQG